ncbi:pentatricopeptide repeat-containing protein At2g36730 [Mercurialis annua]|uniref:pentatricopeptide repeat-containing protein At2g36730 n=1 Tax=Mercurialis annua TaxID=3986 RepID=UPI00215E538E|nr:pentatricopeptide repeat-containing protein At2g36730 [Mercurialis annua]
MVRLSILITSPIFPPNSTNSNSNFLSIKHQCLTLLNFCSSIKHLYQIHAQILVSGLHQDSFPTTQLIKLSSLSSSKKLTYAQSLLNYSTNPLPPSAWNIIIRGYASSNTPRDAIFIFCKMRKQGIRPNNLTFPFLLKACAECSAIKEGKQVHCDVVKYGLDSDLYVNNNLINFYGSCKKILDACKVFDEMSDRAVVSWNAVITSCVVSLKLGEAIGYFLKMGDSGFVPDETTMVLMLAVCTEMGNLSLGRWVHSQVIGRGLVLNYQLGTALVDMYAKSGAVGYAKVVFDKMKERNVWTWSAMILGLAQHGFAEESLQLFLEMMKSSSVQPNSVTFLGVLCACSHAGLVKDGFRYFHEMEHVHGIKPMMVHYGAMVDILGRAGGLLEAYNFIIRMPFQPDSIVWRTLLSACSVHDVKDSTGVADMVRKRLLEQEPRRSGNFVMVANMYADAGMWEKAAKVRRVMRDGGLKKKGGESCVELSGSIYRFFSGSTSLDDKEGMHQLLDELNLHMQMVN